MDIPEVLLISLIVVSVKLLYPLDGIERPPRSHEDPRSTKVDWTQWQQVMRNDTSEASPNLLRGEEYKVTSEDVLSMDTTKLDDFMDWFEKTWIRDDEPKSKFMFNYFLNLAVLTPFLAAERIRQPFQGQGRLTDASKPNKLPNEDKDIERLRSRYAELNGSMGVVEPMPDPEDPENEKKEKQPRDFLPVWRTQEDLPDAAMALYSKAAELASIPLSTLIRGTVQVERRLELWCIEKRKLAHERGKGKAVWTGDDSD